MPKGSWCSTLTSIFPLHSFHYLSVSMSQYQPSFINVVFILTMAASSIHMLDPLLIKKRLTNKVGDFYHSPNRISEETRRRSLYYLPFPRVEFQIPHPVLTHHSTVSLYSFNRPVIVYNYNSFKFKKSRYGVFSLIL